MELKDQAATGLKWSGASQASRQGVQLLTTLMLARLLAPGDFGLLGMAMVIIGFTMLFRDLGTTAAVIQRKELSDELLSSVFWLNFSFGVIFTAVIYFAAPLVAQFYKEPRLIPILRWLAPSFFFASAGMLQLTLLERELRFSKLAKIEIISVCAGSATGISLALRGYGVYSLVFQSLVNLFLNSVLLWLTTSWRPRLVFRWWVVKEIGGYSLNLTGFSIINYFARTIDLLLVGRYLGTDALGYYYFAYRLMLFPLQNISTMIGRVVFPVYAKLQDYEDRFQRAFLKTSSSVALVTFPLMLGMLAVARPFINAVRPEWQPVIPLIKLLVPACMVAAIVSNVASIYKAKGRTDWMFRWTLVGAPVRIAAIVIGLRWGIVGVAAAYSISFVILTYPSLAIPFRLIHLQMGRLVKSISMPLVTSLIMFGVVYFLELALYGRLRTGVSLAVCIVTGAVIYGLLNLWLNREQLTEMITALRTRKDPEG